MSETTFLTPEEVAERYRGSVSVGTLRNWRAMKIGPSFVKIGKAVLYRVDELEAWNDRSCAARWPKVNAIARFPHFIRKARQSATSFYADQFGLPFGAVYRLLSIWAD